MLSTTTVSVEVAGATVEPAIARQLPLYGHTLMFGFALRMAAMFVFTTSTTTRKMRVLPGWFTLAGYVAPGSARVRLNLVVARPSPGAHLSH